ncbi:hypothetical protein [uncultured Acetobacteroides sp.]|uniref:hypothetical protein n=1 Tax=uncultured Acetobacteroides sp. TaxID=1760811 RepID=UPI0029F51B16|nr:hypothetical protein [uncultured Acetobacteroides sp.]
MARTLRNLVAAAALVMLVIAAAHVDYGNLSWRVNASDYKSMVAMACTFTSMICCNAYESSRLRKRSK